MNVWTPFSVAILIPVLAEKVWVDDVEPFKDVSAVISQVEGFIPFTVVNDGVVVTDNVSPERTRFVPVARDVEATGIGQAMVAWAPVVEANGRGKEMVGCNPEVPSVIVPVAEVTVTPPPAIRDKTPLFVRVTFDVNAPPPDNPVPAIT